ncbi:MAG: hypothetical protein WD042_10555 [Phycisphaeraceae bacterium]
MLGVIIGVIFALVFVIAPLTMVVMLITYAAQAATHTVGTCRNCHYDLRGLGDVRACPECGEPFVVNEHGDVIS